MKKKGFAIAFLFLTIALAYLIWLAAPPREPNYRGKPLSHWLEGYNQTSYRQAHPEDNQPPNEADANDAVRNAGVRSIPMLLRMLGQPTPSASDRLFALLNRQELFKISWRPDNHALKALMAFQALGPVATNAMPSLIKMFDANRGTFQQRSIPLIFASIGPPARDAVPSLLRALPGRSPDVKFPIMRALQSIHPDPAIAVPAFTKCLTDPDGTIRSFAARALASWGAEAKSAVPALLDLYRKEAGKPAAFPFTSFEASNAIYKIDPVSLDGLKKKSARGPFPP
jgi:hypothetical protein